MTVDKHKRQHFRLQAAVYLILRSDDKVLLLRRANTGYQDGKYSLIAGHLNGDELATSAMVREAKEEAGIVVEPSKLKLVHLAHRLCREQVDQERFDLFFELWDWQGEVKNMEPRKCDELAWFQLNNLPANIIPFIGLVLKDVSNNVMYSEYEIEPSEK